MENKRVDADFAALIAEANADERAQLARYLKLCDNLVLTDYLRFWRVRRGENGEIVAPPNERVEICALGDLPALANALGQGLAKVRAAAPNSNLPAGDLMKTQASRLAAPISLIATHAQPHAAAPNSNLITAPADIPAKERELLDFFHRFLTAQPKPITRVSEIAASLALRTRELKCEIIANAHAANIAALFGAFNRTLYKELSLEDFADSFAQTLTYSLFLAKLNNPNAEKIDLYNAKKFIPKSFCLIRAMSGFLEELNELPSLQWLLGEMLGIINHIDAWQITRELNPDDADLFGEFSHKDPFMHVYEPFLAQYDPKLRELRGVYYTPAQVVEFIILAVESVLKTEFDCPRGLADALGEDSALTLLDLPRGRGRFCSKRCEPRSKTPTPPAPDTQTRCGG